MWQPRNDVHQSRSPFPNREHRDEHQTQGPATEQPPAICTETVQDHRGNDVKLVWDSSHWGGKASDPLPAFPFQVYLLRGAQAAVRDVDSFATEFVSFTGRISSPQLDDRTPSDLFQAPGVCRYRLDIYTEPFPNILACVAHQEEEVAYRDPNGLRPRLVANWAVEDTPHWYDSYRRRMIIIDQDDWRDEGPIIAQSSLVYDDEARCNDILWGPGNGACSQILAQRISAQMAFKAKLHQWWSDAGHEWRFADLARRNQGGLSPVLYPAQDPFAHYDAQHDQATESEYTAIEHAVNGIHISAPAEERSTIATMDSFDLRELYGSASKFKSFWSESYSDSFGFTVTSVWNSEISRTRPLFAITLYLAFDVLPFEPEALFACLNKGSIAGEPFTLDVVRNIPSLDSAFEYHTRSSARRTVEKTASAKLCTQMLFRKVGADCLPTELLQYIEDLVVPPMIPDYSDREPRRFRNFFLYLTGDRIPNGPFLVYSSHAIGPIPWCRPELIVEDQPFWNRVADRIHTLLPWVDLLESHQ